MDKLYIVVRKDLAPGQQACQGMHALREFVEKFPDQERRWYESSNHLCFLAVKNEDELWDYMFRARTNGIPVAYFAEPHFGNKLTALALSPDAQELCSGLPLALMSE